ncbi:MAG: triphosphoribosyl-dephospho-CoA synthase [Fimbriiglobus sp.]
MIESFIRQACLWEVEARKVGNVHPGARFSNTTAEHFRRSAEAIAPALCQPLALGERILAAVTATQSAVGQNTNLGIILLLAPLAMGEAIVNETTVADCRAVYQAIRLASPGGLNETQEADVRDEPTITLRDAMMLAADRDMVARQYANRFAEVKQFGVPLLREAFAFHRCIEAAIIDTQLAWLAEFPDSLIARKLNQEAAEEVRGRAIEVQKLGGIRTKAGRAEAVRLDGELRQEGHRRNPGTTADLITACLFVALRDNVLNSSDVFPWSVDDWLPTCLPNDSKSA